MEASNNCWELVDQSVHAKRFWQTKTIILKQALFDLVYNVNQDILNEIAKIQYYLSTAPEPNIIYNLK
jgi:ribosomal protein L16 Arg81 hydroxylase